MVGMPGGVHDDEVWLQVVELHLLQEPCGDGELGELGDFNG